MDAKLKKELQKTACKVRMGVIEGTYNAKSGHPGGSLSISDTLTYLYFNKMNNDPKNPDAPDRDRLVLSKGHTAPALYSVLAQKGYFPANMRIANYPADFVQGVLIGAWDQVHLMILNNRKEQK